jgi:hypothetical protein
VRPRQLTVARQVVVKNSPLVANILAAAGALSLALGSLARYMSEVTARLRNRILLITVAGCATALLALSATAMAGQYTVVSCDSAAAFGYNAAAWVPYANAGSAYSSCPTNGGFTAGISNRLTGGTYPGFSHSAHSLTAPAGATITKVRWAGRMARDNCAWGVYFRALPSGTPVLGMPNGQFCLTTGYDTRGWPAEYGVPAGTTRLDQLVICGASQCAPGAAFHSHVVEVTIDDPVAPSISLSGPLASGQWLSGVTGRVNHLDISVSDNAGVHQIETSLGGRNLAQTQGCNWSTPVPCPSQVATAAAPTVADLPDGRHTVWVVARDAAGNSASDARDVYVDNHPPDPVLPEVFGGTGWRRTNGFAVSWSNPPSAAAPITRAHWKLCRPDGSCPSRGAQVGEGVHELPQLLAPTPGDFRLFVWLEDAAGNQREANAAVSVPIRFDPEPPDLAFQPLDPADPLRVVVNASDRHSGVAQGEIEMRETGTQTWHALPTKLEGSQLVSYVDDERFRRGSYEFRARAEDHAGNETSTGKRADGSAATLRLPARIDTRLVVGVLRRVGDGRRRHRFDRNVTARYGRLLRLTGLLVNADGNPIEAATVEALEERPDGTILPIGLATTGREGRFRYVVSAMRNRDLLFRYPGSRRIAAATSPFALHVPAKTSIRVNRARVRNGEGVVFAGRVATRPMPANGKLIEMQAHFRGRWRTFSTLRSDRAGEWNFRYRFGATLGRVIYRFRARLPSEGGYPFISGRSRVAKVLVIGP